MMENETYQEVLEYMESVGLDYTDDKDFIECIVDNRGDSDFTEGVVKLLIGCLLDEVEGCEESTRGLKEELVKFIEEKK